MYRCVQKYENLSTLRTYQNVNQFDPWLNQLNFSSVAKFKNHGILISWAIRFARSLELLHQHRIRIICENDNVIHKLNIHNITTYWSKKKLKIIQKHSSKTTLIFICLTPVWWVLKVYRKIRHSFTWNLHEISNL